MAAAKSGKVEGQPVERAERETIVVSQRTKRLQARGLAALAQSRAAESKAGSTDEQSTPAPKADDAPAAKASAANSASVAARKK